MSKFNFQEPCCIERTLPPLLREYPLLTWQTNGDVTFEKIIKAVSHLAGNVIDIILLIPNADLPILRVLAWYRQRGWLKNLTIVTATDESASIRNEFPIDFAVEIFDHKSVNDPILIIEGTTDVAIVQGPLRALPSPTPTVERFISYAGHDTAQISMLTDTTSALLRTLRQKARKKKKNPQSPTPTSTDAPTSPASPTTPESTASPASSILPEISAN